MKFRVYGAIAKRRKASDAPFVGSVVEIWQRELWVDQGRDYMTGRFLTKEELRIRNERRDSGTD